MKIIINTRRRKFSRVVQGVVIAHFDRARGTAPVFTECQGGCAAVRDLNANCATLRRTKPSVPRRSHDVQILSRILPKAHYGTRRAEGLRMMRLKSFTWFSGAAILMMGCTTQVIGGGGGGNGGGGGGDS